MFRRFFAFVIREEFESEVPLSDNLPGVILCEGQCSTTFYEALNLSELQPVLEPHVPTVASLGNCLTGYISLISKVTAQVDAES